MNNALETIKREMDDLQTRLQRMTDIAADQRRILDLCPMGLPDGTGIMTAEGWIKWAKRRLGYTEAGEQKMKKLKCNCPIYCRFCGAKRRWDWMGHYCPTKNCQWRHGYSTCEAGEGEKK